MTSRSLHSYVSFTGKILSALLLLFLSTFSLAQLETGQIAGTVTDPSGAVVSGAKVTALNMDTGLTRQSTTSGGGNYTIASLPPGNYEVSIDAQGFAPFKQKVTVTVAGRATTDAKLALSSATTTVEVSAETAAQVNTQDQTLSQVVTSTQIAALPSLTRNPYDFVAISGNVASDSSMSQAGNGVGFAINGQRSASTDILLDGGENVDLFSASVGQNVPLDSVQEYRIQTSDYTAEYGRAGGGVVNVVTKSGTNSFHGSAYEYNRISALASNTYFEDASNFVARAQGSPITPHDRFTRNQFGFSLGGPIKHDKLFFFSNTEWTRIRSNGQQIAYVPTPTFIAQTSAATQAFFAQFGKLRPNAIPTGVTQTIAPGAAYTGPPVTGPTFEQVRFAVPSNAGAGDPQNAYSNVDRVDWNISSSSTMFVRYGLQKDNLFPGTNATSAYTGYDTGVTDTNQNGLISFDHIFSPSIINNIKLEYNRLNNLQPLGTAPVGPALYLNKGNTASVIAGTDVNLPGYLPTSPGNAIPFGGPQNIYELNDGITITHGNHTFKFGGEFIQIRDNRIFGAYETSVEQLGQSTTADGVAALLNGTVYNFQGAVDPKGAFPCAHDPNTGAVISTPSCQISLPVSSPSFIRENTFNDGSAYGQDTWKATQRLTLDLGLRWEYYGVQHNSNPNLESNFFFGSGNTIFDQIRNGFVATTPSSPIHQLYRNNYKNFGPRVGFALDVFGNGKTSLRGGYGISYERNFGNVTYNVIQNPPNYAVVSLIAGRDVPTIPLTTSNAGPLAGSGVTLDLPRTSLRAVNPNLKNAYAQQYSLAIEHELTQGTLVSLEYSGSRGEHLYSIENLNKNGFGSVYLGDGGAYGPTGPLPCASATFTPGPGQCLNPNGRLQTQYSNINFRGSDGDSYYNALNLKIQSNNFANVGLQLLANYTYAHSIDDLSSTFSQSDNNFNLGYLDPFDPGVDRGPSEFDIRHRLAFSGVWNPTFLAFKNSSKLLRDTIGGWEIAPIFTVRTGSPFTIFDCTNAVTSCPRILAVPGMSSTGTPVAVFDPNPANLVPDLYNYIALPAAAANPYVDPITGAPDIPTCTGPLGAGCSLVPGIGRDHFYGPGIYNLDLGLYKTIAITERVKMQFRAEAYNVLNHKNFYVNVGNADFAAGPEIQATKGAINGGSPTAADERRNLQLALRIDF